MPASPPPASPWGRRIAIVATSLVSLLVCCGLAWWQWDRFMSASGTFQNLGYVLQWPLFGLFPAFMFWRIRKLRQQAATEEPVTDEPETAKQPEPEVPAPRPRPDVEPSDEDEELAAYNRYLRELHARDQQAAE